MSNWGSKRKRSLQDDPSRMESALGCLVDLKGELGEFEEMDAVWDQILALESVLKGVKTVIPSTVAPQDLKKAGVMRKRLVFDSASLTILTDALTTNAKGEIEDLHSRIIAIYGAVNMDYEPGSRMILDAILLASASIISITRTTGVVILPKMRVAPGDEVKTSHPASGSECGNHSDYVVILYDRVRDYEDRLLARGGSREDAFEISKGRLFLLVTKGQSHEQSIVSCILEAVSRAITLLRSANLPEVCFCLSDGQTWIFFILKLENETLTYYESATGRLSRDVVGNSASELQEIVQLVCEWLSPTMADLFMLE